MHMIEAFVNELKLTYSTIQFLLYAGIPWDPLERSLSPLEKERFYTFSCVVQTGYQWGSINQGEEIWAEMG